MAAHTLHENLYWWFSNSMRIFKWPLMIIMIIYLVEITLSISIFKNLEKCTEYHWTKKLFVMYNLLAKELVLVTIVCRDTKEFHSLFFIQLRKKYFAFVCDLFCAESWIFFYSCNHLFFNYSNISLLASMNYTE